MSRFDGDPKITITPDGADMHFTGGQPIMDQGIENQATLSLFTKEGWCGNVLFDNPDEKIGSDFQDTAQDTITLTSLDRIRLSAQKALESPIFGDVNVAVSNPHGSRVDMLATIEPRGRDQETLLFEKNGINWINQKIDPAYRKV